MVRIMEFKKRVVDDEKERVTLTLDKNLIDNLDKLKKIKRIRKLSTKMNAVLWNWFANEVNESGES